LCSAAGKGRFLKLKGRMVLQSEVMESWRVE